MSQNLYTGISFPFRFNSQGRVEKSKLSHDDFSRIKESIQQIIFTYKMERVMVNSFGRNRDILFTAIDDLTEISLLRHDILKAIELYEDRVEVEDCNIYPHPEIDGTLIIELKLLITKFMKTIDIRILFELNGTGGDS